MPTSAPEVGEVEEGFSSVVAAAGVKVSVLFVWERKRRRESDFAGKQEQFMGFVGRRWSTADCCEAREWPPLSSTTWGVKRRVPSRGVEPQRVPGNPRVLNHARLLPADHHTLVSCARPVAAPGLPSWQPSLGQNKSPTLHLPESPPAPVPWLDARFSKPGGTRRPGTPDFLGGSPPPWSAPQCWSLIFLEVNCQLNAHPTNKFDQGCSAV